MAMTKRQQQAEETKKKIIETATVLLHEIDYDAITVNTIVEKCGLAHGTFYRYFKNKDELMTYLLREPYEQLIAEIRVNKTLSFGERLKLFIGQWYQLIVDESPYFARFITLTMVNKQQEQPSGFSPIEEAERLVMELFKDGINRDELLPTVPYQLIAGEIVFSMYGALLYHCACPDSFHVMGWANGYISVLFDVTLAPYFIKKE